MQFQILLVVGRDSLIAQGGSQNVAGYGTRGVTVSAVVDSGDKGFLEVVEVLQRTVDGYGCRFLGYPSAADFIFDGDDVIR